MATVNQMIICTHCKSKIRLRIGIGYSQRQPFTFTCKGCGTLIQGALILKEATKTDLEIENATINNTFKLKEADYIVECHEDFLLTNEPVGEGERYKLTPFMRTLMLIGPETFPKYAGDRSLFNLNQIKIRNKLFRINNFFSSNRINELKEEAIDFFCCESKLEIYKSLAQLNEIYFLPILNRNIMRKNTTFFYQKVMQLLKDNPNELLKFIEEMDKTNFFLNQIKENLSILERFDGLFFVIKPIITLNYIDKKEKDILNFSIVDFEKTRHFYQDLFECVGRELDVLIGLMNIELNKDHNFFSHIKYPNLNNFHECRGASNGEKKDFLKLSADYSNIIKDIFDNQLRNGIGHHKCRLILEKMEIEYYPYINDITQARKKTIKYLDFILNLYNLLNLLVSLLYLKTILYVILKAKQGQRAIGIREVKLVIKDNEPKIQIIHYWNEANYSRKSIIDYEFDYWFFENIYLKFNLVEKNAAKINLNEEVINLNILGSNRTHQFKVKDHQEWIKLLRDREKFKALQEIFIPDIPFLKVKPNQLLQ